MHIIMPKNYGYLERSIVARTSVKSRDNEVVSYLGYGVYKIYGFINIIIKIIIYNYLL